MNLAATKRRDADSQYFLDFFWKLREYGLKVGLAEWLAVYRALLGGLHDHTLDGFYELARMMLVKHERDFDTFDLVFMAYFRDRTYPPLPDIHRDLEEWLKNAADRRDLAPEELEALEQAERSLEEHLAEFERLLREQDEQHDGGNRWVGTGGTSPYGHSGSGHQSGFRVGGEAGGRSALQVAGERRFAGYREDVILDTRQFKVALKGLRRLAREGKRDELDMDGTIEATARNAGDIDLIFRPERKNSAKLLLMMDTGGSMTPYASLGNALFSAAHQLNHFKDFQHYFFHNCIYQFVYRDDWHHAERQRVPLVQLLQKYDPSYKVLFVGDACMAPHELYHPYFGGGVSGWDVFQNLRAHFKHAVWLNPEPAKYWNHETIRAIGSLFPMFPFTVKGLSEAVGELTEK